MFENVDEQVLRLRRIFRHPVTNAFHVMPFEDCIGVITEPRFERIHFGFVNVIQTQFVNVVRLFCIRAAKGAKAEHHGGPAKKREQVRRFHRFD